MRVLGLDGSPQGGGRTYTAMAQLLDGAARAGADSEVVSLGQPLDLVLTEVRRAQAFVFGSPVYRASYAAPLKEFLDRLPRGRWGETEMPITAKAVAIVMTGASWHHYLALGQLRSVLAGFFAAHVLSPGLYVPAEGFGEDKQLTEAFAALAQAHGRALVALARGIESSAELQAVEPQA